MTALENRVVITFCVLFSYILGYGQVNVFFSDTSRQDQIWYDSLTPQKQSDTLSLKDKVITNDFKNFSNNIYRLILKPDHSYSTINSDSLILSVYQPYQGLVIRNIIFNQLNTFGQELNDTTQKVLNFAQKAGNKTHFKTSERVLRNRLLIKEGDKIDPVILADNERLLRELSFIQDARIYIEHDTMSKDSIDLIVVIKDKWSMAFSAEIFDVDYGKIGIWNQNLFGLGNEIYFQTNYKFNRTPIVEFKTEYKINNIYNTLIETKLGYEKKEDKEVSRIHINRNFITPGIRYGGGLNFMHMEENRELLLRDTIISNLQSIHNYYDIWLGRSFNIMQLKNYFTRTSLFMTARYTNYHFLSRPEVMDKLRYYYQNKDILLFSFGIKEVGYFKTKLVYDFGNTEDIPFGKSLNFIYGLEYNDFGARNYIGLEMAAGGYYPGLGYIYNQARLTSFYDLELEQGLLSYKLNYFSPIIGKNRYLTRFYLSAYYNGGFSRFSDEYFPIEKNSGIRGLQNKNLLNRQELYFNAEAVLFSPHYLYGFRFVYFLFADTGVWDHQDNEFFKNPWYSGIGIGTRIKNPRLVFNTIQLRLAYYPKHPPHSNLENFQLLGIPGYKTNDFNIHPPEIITYDNRKL